MNNLVLEGYKVMKLTMKKSIIVVSVLLIPAMLLSACSGISIGKSDPTPTAAPQASVSTASQGVIAEGHVAPKEYKYLSFPTAGHVAEILVKKGETVSSGQALARLSDTEQAQASLQASLAEVQTAQQALDDLNRTAALTHSTASVALVKAQQALTDAQKAWDTIDTQKTHDEIEDAKTKVADAQKELNNAKDDFEPYKDLPQENSQRKAAQSTLDDANKTYSDAVSELDTLQNAYDLARATLQQATETLAEAQHHFDQTQDGPDPAQLKLAQMQLEVANAHQAAAQAALDNMELKTPIDGTVLDVNVVKNELVGPSNWSVLVGDTSEWYIRTSDLTELEAVNIEPGQKVEIVPDALPDVTLTGVVEEISNTFTTKSGDILYEVKIKLNETDPRLKWGMTVEARFQEK
jgi:multidrug efflux pump subunit AcrA (membrane-fusion protein)